jgi:hypothetical protein
MISLHIQTETEGTREFVRDMHDAGNPLRWIKLVKGFELAPILHSLSPPTYFLAREINHPKLWEDPESQARHIVGGVWDSIVTNRIDALESTNELFGTTATTDELKYWVSLEVAISNEIKRRSDILYAETGREVMGVLIHAPIGNLQHGAQTALMQPIIDVALLNKHGIGYHPYYPAILNIETVRRWLREEGYHHHLRLQLSWAEVLDGLLECPIFYTEAGAIEVYLRDDGRPAGYKPNDGWRSCHANIDEYVECLLRLKAEILAAPGGGKVETLSLFTTGDPRIIGWDSFIVGKDEYPALRAALT